ncbi:MAG: DNA polymerase III subunit alpha [Proteobacteria bacterium]|nr:DNA polymerase III subunit alpha [Pseudomonadota bacterium]
MNNQPNDFIHLHVHTQYSLLDGAIRLGPLLKTVADFGMDAVAITDHGTMFGSVEFYDMAVKAGIKPIIGCEVYVAPRKLTDKTAADGKNLAHLVLLAENQEGYKNLCKLASIAQLEGFYYKPRVDKDVLQIYNKGIIALSACLAGEIPRLLSNNKPDEADQAARFYQGVYGEDNFFLEVQDIGMDIQNQVNEKVFDMAKRLSIPVVATNDCHYLKKEDSKAHEVLLCVQTGSTMNDPNRFQFGTDQLYFKSPKEMRTAFSDYPDVLSNTVDISKRCNIEFDFKTYHFPKFESDTGLSTDELFEKEVRKGFEKRLAYIKSKHPGLDEAVYRERLDYEIGVIIKMGFPGYFLIVADFIRYGKENGVPVGPGRGSAAGSIVAYSMGITDLDPIEHGLIFERFLNPARVSMPDIDVDFCINGREKVFKYVVNRYGGGDYVAQIITFGKLKTKLVIRDVGRALGIPLKEVDAICKMVPDEIGIKLDQALTKEPKIKELIDTRPDIAELINICKVLEGLPRHCSTHAAGVVVSDKPLVEYLPTYRGKNGEVVTQLDMKRVEQIGLVKFDFLGLRNLTVIEDCLKIIEGNTGKRPDLLEIDFEDKKTFHLLSTGDTTGVFQLESSGMKDLLVRLKPECFNDIIALVALYRPGPLDSGMVDAYVERKHGREPVVYEVPELEAILKETYGVILYQEQVMKIAGVLASYTMAEADGLRKAMGKKIASLMAEHRDLFMKGAVKNNVPEDKAKTIFDLMETFGGYGFNKSHSAAYALIAYQTAFLKTHYPVEFMAALLTSEMGNADSVVKFISECRSHNIFILPPDVNKSRKEFRVEKNSIRFGLVAVKNVGEGAIDSILQAREDGPFSSLFDFCERVSLRKVNKRVLEALIKCGAFDSTGDKRAQMMTGLEAAIDHGQRIQKEKNDRQLDIFSSFSNIKFKSLNQPALPQLEEWREKNLLAYEKEALGFYISGHPLSRHEDILSRFTNANAITLNDVKDVKAVRIGGIVIGHKPFRTKKGDLMAFVTLEDMNGSIEVVVFPKVYETVSSLVIIDKAVIIEGEAKREENTVKLFAENIVPIEKAEETWAASISINIDADKAEEGAFIQLTDIIKKYPGTCPVFVNLRFPGKYETALELPDNLKLNISQAVIREIDTLIGYRSVETTCTEINLPAKKNGFNGRKKKYGT